MPLICLEDDEDQRWVPTHVNVTVQRARGLRIKGKQSSRYVYTVIQLGKEKYTTGLAEKAAEPEWNEECSLELQPGLLECMSAHAPGSSHVTLTVMLRVLIGLDMFLGEAVVPLDKIFQDGTCPKNHWLKLHSKSGRKEKERGELQVTVQFTRNNMTASMYDLTIKDKPRSAFGKLKDRVTGKKRGDVESSSAILPGRYAALSSSTSQSIQEDRMGVEPRPEECGDERKSKVKDFFLKGKLRKNSDTHSCSSLASESSNPSSAGDPFVPVELCSTPVYSSRVVEPFRSDSDWGTLVNTTPKVLTHKRAYSDEASKITAASRPCPVVENLKGQNTVLSKSTLCINGSHIYSEPVYTKGPGSLPIKRTLLEKCSPLSRSLQNLTRRSEDTQRRSSIDKSRKESDGETESYSAQRATTSEGKPVHATAPLMTNTTTAEVTDKGKKLRKTLFSSGRSDSLPAKTEQGQESRLRGWFGSGDTQNKPRLGIPPKVESSPDTSSSLPPCFPKSPPRSLPLIYDNGHKSSSNHRHHTNPFTHPLHPPPSISPTNPFLLRLQKNPFFEELIAEEALKSPPANSCYPNSPFGHSTVIPGLSRPTHVSTQNKSSSIKRERPRSVARQSSLPTLLPVEPETSTLNSCAVQANARCPLSDCRRERDEFELFATSRLKSPVGTPTRPPSTPIALLHSNYHPVDYHAVKPNTGNSEGFPKHCDLPALPPRRPTRTPVALRERYSDGWLDRAQELAVQKEACVLLETDLASLRHARETNSHVSNLSKEPSTFLQSAALEQNDNESPPSNAAQMPRDENRNILGHGKESVLTQRAVRSSLIGSYGNEPVESLPENGTLQNPIYLYERIEENSQYYKSDHTVPSTPFCLSDCDTTVSESLCSDFQAPLNPDSSCEPNPKSNLDNDQDSNNNQTGDTSEFAFIDCDSSPSDSKIQSRFEMIHKGSNKASVQDHGALGIPDDLLKRMTTDLEQCSPKQQTPDIVAHNSIISQGTLITSGTRDLEGISSDVLTHSNLNVKTEHKESSITPQETNCGDDSVTSVLKPEATKNNAGLESPCEVGGHLINNEFNTTRTELKAEDHKVLVTESSIISDPVDDVSFEDLHARVAPRGSRSPSKTEVRSARIRTRSTANSPKSEPRTCSIKASSDIESAKPLLDQVLHNSASPCSSNAIADSNLSILMHTPAINPELGSTRAEASYTTSTAQMPATAQHTLPPDEADPPSSLLPPEESSPHPVKPLTNSAVSGDKKSVLEKLRSSIHPGRSTQQNTAEPEKSQVSLSEAHVHYLSLSNMELIALLLQQEVDVERQRAESELQATLLEKREAEVKKLKAQVRDLEDYIDKLLVRIMEQTPTLLQVRGRPK